MGVETGDLISELNEAWPAGDEPRREGDDHLRLIKRVIKNDALSKTAGQVDIDARVLRAGDTMTGKLNTKPSSAAGTGLNLGSGSNPTTPQAGDVWTGLSTLSFYDGFQGQIVQVLTGQQAQSVTGTKSFTSTAAGAPLRVPHGVAPSAPTNGELWTTTAGVFARINGATVGPLTGTTDISAKEDKVNKGAADGYAPLDGGIKVPAAYLPAYVDDVVEYANLAAFPGTGTAGLIYVALDTNKVYRWGGSSYTEISPSPGSTDAVPEGATNLYFTDARASAAAPVQSVSGKTDAVTLVKADVGLSNVDNTSDVAKPVSTAQAAADALRVLKAGDTMTSHLFIGTTANPTLYLSKPLASGYNMVAGRTGTSLRWVAEFGDGTAEGGANAGSNFRIGRYDDAGVLIDRCFQLTRATGLATFTGQITTSYGVLLVSSASTSSSIYIRKAASAQNATIYGQTASASRWALTLGDTNPESTGNAGSDYALYRYNDAGTFIDSVMSVVRSTGITTLKQLAVTTGPITVGGVNVATATDLAGKEPTITIGTTSQYWRGDKTWQTLDKLAVGLDQVDNTSDVNKPVSTAQNTADQLRVLKAGDTMTGALVLPLGAVATPSLTFVGGLTSGIYAPSVGQVAITVNSAVRVQVSAATTFITNVLGLTAGTAAAASAHFGTAGTGLWGSSTAVSVATAGVNRLTIDAAAAAFATKVTTPASATGGAGIVVPHGAAPTSPANGDFWSTSSGFFGRVNGVTIGPFGAAGAGGIADAPNDGSTYGRKNLGWVVMSGGTVGEAPTDGKFYARLNATWSDITDDFAGKEATIAAGTTAQYYRGDKSWQTLDKAAVGLANVDNTSDVNKPVSTAQNTADLLRVLKAGDTMTGDLTVSATVPSINISKVASGQSAALSFKTGANMRWKLEANNAAESADAGSNFVLTRYDDAGVGTSAITIARSTFGATFGGNINITKASPTVTVSKTSAAQNSAMSFGHSTTGLRWAWYNTNVAESGGASGTGGQDFELRRYDNSGVQVDTPILVTRLTGIVTIKQLAVTTAPITVAGINVATVNDLMSKEDAIAAGTSADVWQGDKTWTTKLGLPISTAAQAAIDLKLDATHAGTGGAAHADVTTSVDGFMTAADKLKLDGIASGAIAYVHPSGDGNLHVPATGTTSNGKVLKAAGTAGSGAWQTLTKTDVGLANVDNTTDLAKPISTATQTALNLKENSANKGIANGYAPLDASTKIAATYLPAYVDDVLEYANLAAFPGTGTVGIIYVALDSNKTYRWGGSSYTEISPSPGSTDAVPEGSVNLYYTNVRAAAAAPVQSVAGRVGAIVLAQADITSLVSDLALKAPLASPALSGTPTAPTAAQATNTTQIATTAHVQANAALKANLASPTFTGTPAAPTASAGTSTTQLATTAFVTTADALKANLASPVFTGNPTSLATLAAGDNDTSLATTAFVQSAIAAGGATNRITLSGTTTEIVLNKDAAGAGSNLVSGKVGGEYRWAIDLGNAEPETGGNAGSNFVITNYDDDGIMAGGSPLKIMRATGEVIAGVLTTVTQALGVSNTKAATTEFVQNAMDSRDIKHRVYSSVGTTSYVPPAGLRFLEVWVQGGGGGGGGALGLAGNNSVGGGGGGGGGVHALFRAGELPASITIIIGAAGISGTANTVGGAGGVSSFSYESMNASGGAGGGPGADNALNGVAYGGAGGGASTTGLGEAFSGPPGINGIKFASNGPALGGVGGASVFGGGGGQQKGSPGSTGNGGDLGAGGCGGYSSNNTGGAAGGPGGKGFVRIKEYY